MIGLAHDFIRQCGGQVFLFRLSHTSESGLRSQHELFAGCDPRWIVEYTTRAWFANDPFDIAQRRGVVRYGELKNLTAAQRGILAHAARYGFRHGLVVHHGSTAGDALLYIGAESAAAEQGLWGHRTALRAFVTALTDWHLLRDDAERFVSDGALTPEESAILGLVREGATARLIADQLKLSEKLVRNRLRSAYRKHPGLSRRVAGSQQLAAR
ncbi:MAG: LuxR C-terminal-related transcriptional regulator [Betaproteobacteria bacterium]